MPSTSSQSMIGPNGADALNNSESHQVSEEKQISTLLVCLGEEARSVLSSTNASEADRKEYNKVIDKLVGFSIHNGTVRAI